MNGVSASAWLPFGAGPGAAPARLFCLPFAGGGASNFAAWRTQLHAAAAVPLQYPGHETRLDEAPLRSIDAMLDGLTTAVLPWLDRPYLLFGYSMGAKLAFGLARRLQAHGAPAPAALLVAAHRPPHLQSAAARTIGLPDDAFVAALRGYGGLPDELYDDPDFRAMFVPIMRADFEMAVQPLDLTALDCPIIAYAGLADDHAAPADMAQWDRYSTASFRLRAFAGGHFFLRSARDFLPALEADAAAVLAAAAATV